MDRLYGDWLAARERRASGETGATAHIENLLSALAPNASLVTVLDGHPATLSWIGSVGGHRPYPLGVTRFGESGDIIDLYAKHGIDAESIVRMAALACVEAAQRR